MNNQMTTTAQQEAKDKAVTVKVNGKAVTFQEHRVTGADIKAIAIAQGVAIQSDFALFEVKGQGQLKPVGDADTVTINKNSEFRAVAPDDNS